MKKNIETLSLRITEENLLKIASGEKKIEYRSGTLYYEKMLVKAVDEKNKAVFYPFNKIHLFCGNISGGGKQLTAELTAMYFVQFFDQIPEEFKKGDLAFELHIGKIIEKNL